jgi:hypothetical protein
MKSIGESVILRLGWGDPPEIGDILRMKTGRQYGVTDVRGKRIDCVVLNPEAKPVAGRVLDWRWAKRTRKYGRRPR